MAYESLRDWNKFIEEWNRTPHHQTIDADAVRLEDLQSLLVWDTPLENLPPEVIELILGLESRLRKAEEKISDLEGKLKCRKA